MLTRSRAAVLVGLALWSLAGASCERTPLVAPTGSTITLTTDTNAMSATGTADILAQVLESAGTPPHSGTHVTFTTTLGRILPVDAETDASGRAVVKFIANGTNGTAVISASSGGASTGSTGALKIAVGAAAVGKVVVAASPNPVSSNGGTAAIAANVVDVNGNALVGVPVTFTTTAGTLGGALINTDVAGIAQTTLTTSTQATVTATVGLTSSTTGTGSGSGSGAGSGAATTSTSTQASATVTVNVSVAPSVLITTPTTPPSKGLPSTYTFVVTPAAANGSAVRSVVVDWGDGGINDLGSFTGSQAQTHVYNRDGSFQITATVTDISGSTSVARSTVTIVPVASPTIIITPSVPSSCTGASDCTVTFLLQVTPPTGVGIVNVTVLFGTSPTATPPEQGLGGLTGSATLSTRYKQGAGTQTITVTVADTLGRTTQGFTTIFIP